MAVDGVGDSLEEVLGAVNREGLEGMESSDGRAGIFCGFEDVEGENTGAVDDPMVGCPINSFADLFDGGVGGCDVDDLGILGNPSVIIHDIGVGKLVAQPISTLSAS